MNDQGKEDRERVDWENACRNFLLSNENVLDLDGGGADMGPYICQNSKRPTSNGFILMHVT